MLLLAESWDGYGGDTTAALRKWANSPLTSTLHARSGWAWYGGSGAVTDRAISPQTTTLIFGCRVWWGGLGTTVAQNGVVVGFTQYPGFDGFNAVCGLNLQTDGKFNVTRSFNGGTILGTSTVGLVAGTPSTIAAKFTLGASGAYQVYLDGVSILSGSGNMGGTTVGGIHLGGSLSTLWALDDLWLLDSAGASLNDFPARPVIIPCLFPNADGTVSLTPSAGGSHYPNVDDVIPNDDTDYNGGAAGTQDLYGFDLSPLAGHDLYAAQVSACVKATSAGSNFVSLVAADTVPILTRGIGKPIGTSYGYVEQVFDDRMFG